VNSNPEENPELENKRLPLAMSDQQAKVFELLQSLSTQEKHFHKWYQGVLEIINSRSPDKIAQAAHSIRELCDELPAAIAGIPKFVNPISAAKPLGPQFLDLKIQSYAAGWKGEVINQPLDELLGRFEKIFSEPPRSKRLGRALTGADPQGDFLSKDWRRARDKAFEDLYGFFQNVAHHNHLADEAELIDKLQGLESLLLNYLTPCTETQQKELLALATGPANAEAFSRVRDLISHKTANFAFFFEKLENPDWLPILDAKGLFKNLPGPEPTENGRIMYRHHIPLIVLTRLAGTAPQVVTEILIKLRLPDNPHVGDQVLQCMAKLRDPACIRRLSPLTTQFRGSPARSTWLWIQDLLKSWMEVKAFPEIFDILRAYLDSAVDRSSEQLFDDSRGWLAKQIEEHCLQKLTQENPIEITKIVFHALCRWAEQERERYSQSEISDDAPSSYFVEDFKGAPREHRGIEAVLARRLFLAAEQVYIRGDIFEIGQLDQMLRTNPWQLFRRLRWQLYADFPVLTLQNARAEVIRRMPFLNEIDYNRGAHDYEFAQLLVAHVKQHGNAFLSAEEVRQFAEVVWRGPLDNDGKLLEGDNNFFYRTQLWPISPLLQGEQLAAYRAIIPDDSMIKIERFKPFSSGGVSGGSIISVAPKEVEAFGSMTDVELWHFLNEWESKSGYHQDSTGKLCDENIFALAEKFADFIDSLPQRFTPVSKWWENIFRQEILNKILDRAVDELSKVKNDSNSPSEDRWQNWFGICQWVMTKPFSRHSVSRFLRHATKSDCVMPDNCLLQVPNLLRRLIEEPDTALSRERNGFGDWMTTAINSVRGQTIEALLSLALHQKNAGKEIEPWIFDLIQSRLKLPTESPAIFALFGANLRFLIHMFATQFKSTPDLLFPSDRPEHRFAAVTAHVKYDQPWNLILNTFPNLIGDALNALEGMQEQNEDRERKQNQRDFGSRLGAHIAGYYWSGSFESDSEGEAALDRFFDTAPETTRAALVGQIASIWERHVSEPSEEKIISRVLRIWERRYEQIEKSLGNGNSSSEYESELSKFIDWLSCECFPFEWRFKYAKLSLQKLKKSPQAYHLLKAIAEFSILPDRLESVLELLEELLKRPSNELRWSIQFNELAPVISLGLESDKQNTKKLAKECKDLLLKIGFSDFLNLGEVDKKT
jgi:hypothetical protein